MLNNDWYDDPEVKYFKFLINNYYKDKRCLKILAEILNCPEAHVKGIVIEILRQNIIDRSISAYDDYELQKQYGANIHGLIGLSNVKEVESRVTSNIIYALTHDGFLNKDNINLFKLDATPTSIGFSISDMEKTFRYNGDIAEIK